MSIALIVYHLGYLEEHLHPDSILRYSLFWTDDTPFPEKVAVKCPWDATRETPEITGVPPDIVLLTEMELLQQKMQDLKDELKLSFELTLIDQLDQRKVGGSGFARGDNILEKAETLLKKVSHVSFAAQVSPSVLPPPPCDDPVEFGYGGVCVSGNKEEDVVLALGEPE